jgi:hypothetical protein
MNNKRAEHGKKQTLEYFSYTVNSASGISNCDIADPSIIAEKKREKNSMVCVRERTIPTERPPLVGEVIANFCG